MTTAALAATGWPVSSVKDGASAPDPAIRTGPPEDDAEYLGDMTLLERNLDAQEAQLLASCLRAAGLHADAGDTQIVQTHSLMAIAVGGACIRVPAAQVEEAQAVLVAFRRGDFELGEDFDVTGQDLRSPGDAAAAARRTV